MLKKILTLCLIMCLLLGVTGTALAADITAHLEKYADYTMDELTGEWKVTSNESRLAWQLLRRCATSYTDSFVFVELELSGNVKTGRITPVLQITYVDAEEILPSCVSFVINGVRYDYTVSAVKTTVGYEHAEIIRIPMDENGLAMLREMAAAERVYVKLGGGKANCEVTLRTREKYASPVQQVHGLAQVGLTAMLNELDTLDFASYALYDLNAADWKRAGGFESEYQAVVLQGEDAEFPLTLDEDFEMLSSGNSGRSVTKLQERLMDLGYLYMTVASGSYYEATATAVRAAQTWYGMLPTGNADAAFVEKLFSDDQSPALPTFDADPAQDAAAVSQDTEAVLGSAYMVEGKGQFCLNRRWFASSVSSLSESAIYAQRSVTSSDNCFLIADGAFTNLSTAEMSLFSDLTATAVYNGEYRYECQIVCEANGGERFDTVLLPLASARLVIYAEIPATLAGEPFQLEVQLGDYLLTYSFN